MKKSTHVAALVGIAALTLAGCGERPGDNEDSTGNAGGGPTAEVSDTHTPEGQHPDFKACMVSDSGGFDDKSFNQTSHDGMVSARKQYGIQTAEVQSNSDAEYENNIRALVRQKCDQITTVGFKLGAATDKLAKANPKVDFAIVDFAYFNDAGENVAQKNVKGLTFNTDEPAFMAGYLAASQSQSGIVGTLGGAKIPTVTIFMDGFAKGVEYYNEQKDADVKVIGYDPATQDGSFTDDFENKSKGESLARTLIAQGADVIMPVAGPAGLGSLAAVKEAGEGVRGIWVDTDGCVSASEYCDVLLTSVMKEMDVAVEEAIEASIMDETDNEPYVGTLENGGVALAPFHQFEGEIDQDTKDELAEIREQIIAGELETS